MAVLITLAIKDLLLLTRNYASLFWIFIFPLLLALFFGVTFGGRGQEQSATILFAFVDQDKTDASKKLLKRLQQAKELEIREQASEDRAREGVRKGRLAAFLVVPKGFGDDGAFFKPNAPALKLGVDPSRQATAGFLQGKVTEAYFAGLQDLFSNPKQFSGQLPGLLKDLDKNKNMPENIRANLKNLFKTMDKVMANAGAANMQQNSPFQQMRLETVSIAQAGTRPQTSFEITFPSSVLWGIIGCVQAFVISIVIERTEGTFLRLRIAPLSWWQLLAGKALACFSAAVFVSFVLLILGRLVFGVRLQAPVQLVMAIVCTAWCFVGLMMLLCTLGKTVPGVAGAAWGIMMPLAMIGGAMIPLFVMPSWMLQISHFSPVKWGILSLEGAIWREYTLFEMLLPCSILLAIGTMSFFIGVKKLAWGEG